MDIYYKSDFNNYKLRGGFLLVFTICIFFSGSATGIDVDYLEPITISNQYCFSHSKYNEYTKAIEVSIHSAFKNWSAVMSGILERPFEFKYMGYCEFEKNNDDNDIHVIKFAPKAGRKKYILGRVSPRFIGNDDGVLIHSASDIELNSRWVYEANEQNHKELRLTGFMKEVIPEVILPYSKKFCFENIVAHEIGHALGATHTIDMPDTLMCDFECNLSSCVTLPTESEIYNLKKTYKRYENRILLKDGSKINIQNIGFFNDIVNIFI